MGRRKVRWVLDAYSCAGGATVGYQRAGFRVLGVDCIPWDGYPGDERPK